MNTIQLPAAGQRVGLVTGPGEFASDKAGSVITQVDDRWGSHALVMMDSGEVKKCNGLNSRPGIGWHAI
jgi:hypothetical protein